MKNMKVIMNGPLFFQLLVYAVFIAMNLLQFDEVNMYDKRNNRCKQEWISIIEKFESFLVFSPFRRH